MTKIKQKKIVKMKVWVALIEENKEFKVYATRTAARKGVEELEGFDLEAKAYPAWLLIKGYSAHYKLL